jgi:hypothetical protein
MTVRESGVAPAMRLSLDLHHALEQRHCLAMTLTSDLFECQKKDPRKMKESINQGKMKESNIPGNENILQSCDACTRKPGCNRKVFHM